MSREINEGAAGTESVLAGPPRVVDFTAGAVFVLIALIASWSLWTDPYLELGKVGDDPGPSFIPWIGTMVIGLGGLAQMIWVLIKAKKAGVLKTSGEFVVAKLWLPALLVVSLIIYQLAMKPLGFFTASIIFAIPWVAVFHWRSGGAFTKRYLIQLPLEAVLIAGGIYSLFYYGINVPFP